MLLGRLAILGGGFLFVGVVAKVLAVSRMDLTVAQVIATQSSPSAIVFGALLLFFPLIPVAGMNIALFALVKELLFALRSGHERRSAQHVLYPAVAFGIFFTLGAYLTPSDLFLQFLFPTLLAPLVGILFAIALVAARAVRRRRKETKKLASLRWDGRLVRGILLAFVVIYAVAITFVALPVLLNEVAWLPPRQVELTDTKGFVGYEISRTDHLVTFLRESDRKIVDVSLEAIESTQPCRLIDLVNTAAPLMPLSVHRFQATPACT
jgi:hypothetical protein